MPHGVEAEGRCESCYRVTMLTDHHIVFKSHGGSDEPDNIICLCVQCHNDVQANRIPRRNRHSDIPVGDGRPKVVVREWLLAVKRKNRRWV